jgi:dipeptidase E
MKIVAIGGGENGRQKSDGSFTPYETEIFDKEIIALSGKEKPNVLFLAHAQWIPEKEIRYIETMERIYEKRFNCNYKFLYKHELKENFKKAVEFVKWADIIYVGGGDTISMIKLWKETGFDKLLESARECNKVLCGVSAGAICWFESGHTLNPEYLKKEINEIYGLGFINAYFSPHSNYEGKLESIKQTLKHTNKIGVLLSNCCAFVIVDDKFKVLKSDASNYGIYPFCKKVHWNNQKYIEQDIKELTEFRPLSDLTTL